MDTPVRLHLPEVDSTNTYARRHFRELADGTLVSASIQTAGRGRVGRKWYSGTGENITASVIFKNLLQPFHAGVISSVAAIDLAEEALPGSNVYLKWPNDLYYKYFKLCGMLSEAVWEQGRAVCCICGLGININATEEELASAGQPAASFRTISGEKFDVDFLTDRLAKLLNRYYIIYQQYPEQLLARWRSGNRLAGCRIEVVDPSGNRMQGIFRDIADDGAMLFEHEGILKRFDCGDVKVDAAVSGIW